MVALYFFYFILLKQKTKFLIKDFMKISYAQISTLNKNLDLQR